MGILDLPLIEGDEVDACEGVVAESRTADETPLGVFLLFLFDDGILEDGLEEVPGALTESVCEDDDAETVEEAGRPLVATEVVCSLFDDDAVVDDEEEEDALPARRSAQVKVRPLPLGELAEGAVEAADIEAFDVAPLFEDMMISPNRQWKEGPLLDYWCSSLIWRLSRFPKLWEARVITSRRMC